MYLYGGKNEIERYTHKCQMSTDTKRKYVNAMILFYRFFFVWFLDASVKMEMPYPCGLFKLGLKAISQSIFSVLWRLNGFHLPNGIDHFKFHRSTTQEKALACSSSLSIQNLKIYFHLIMHSR